MSNFSQSNKCHTTAFVNTITETASSHIWVQQQEWIFDGYFVLVLPLFTLRSFSGSRSRDAHGALWLAVQLDSLVQGASKLLDYTLFYALPRRLGREATNHGKQVYFCSLFHNHSRPGWTTLLHNDTITQALRLLIQNGLCCCRW